MCSDSRISWGNVFRQLWAGLLLLLALVLCVQAEDAPALLNGVVKDSSGAVVSGARVEVVVGTSKRVTVTDPNGEFKVSGVPASSGIVSVSAAGFESQRISWTGKSPNIEVHLRASLITQQMTVVANRTSARIVDTPTSVVVLSPSVLSTTAALTTDDMLRQVPGFSLFRRSDSRTANPTSQGVSLRGLGASGASRALVLADGFPLNDPFGGWVYWDRVPRAEIARIEVANGGASHLYGSDALGGVINIFRTPLSENRVSLELAEGNEHTPNLSVAGTKTIGSWSLGAASDLFRTDGYINIPPSLRGPVDKPVNSQHASGEVSIGRQLSRGDLFARYSLLGESRHNGTSMQSNSTTVRETNLGANWHSDELGALSLRGYASYGNYYQTFSSIAPDRSSETLVRIQRVPAQRVGVSAQWSKPLGNRQNIVAGVEEWNVHGQSNEFITATSSTTSAGGREVNWAAYGEDIVRVTPRSFLTISGRIDHWLDFHAFSQNAALPDRTETFFSPRAALLHHINSHVAFTASAYRSFRAPTLNELYRSFRLGNILTLANKNLRAERLTGVEAGSIVTGWNERLIFRGNFFWNDITRPVANVTLSQTPSLITRERENLGRTRSRGVELEAEAQVTRGVWFSGGYQYTDASVTQGDSALVGRRIAQIPRNQFEIQARYSRTSLTAGMQARFVGEQFDDDLNVFLLRRYFTLDALVAYPLRPGVEIFGAAENLLNQRIDVGRTPVLTVGPPVLVRAGVRLQFGKK